MTDSSIECQTGSLAGPVDQRAIAALEDYRQFTFDSTYIAALPFIHGGIPVRQYLTTPSGKVVRIGRFLPIVDEHSTLTPPEQPSWETPGRDVRIDRSIETLIDQEGTSCQCLFAGERLIPFAALYAGHIHPDGMSLTSGDCDLLCFDHLVTPPAVVLWRADDALTEFLRLDDTPLEEDEPVDYDSFMEPVADCFQTFAELLKDSPL